LFFKFPPLSGRYCGLRGTSDGIRRSLPEREKTEILQRSFGLPGTTSRSNLGPLQPRPEAADGLDGLPKREKVRFIPGTTSVTVHEDPTTRWESSWEGSQTVELYIFDWLVEGQYPAAGRGAVFGRTGTTGEDSENPARRKLIFKGTRKSKIEGQFHSSAKQQADGPDSGV